MCRIEIISAALALSALAYLVPSAACAADGVYDVDDAIENAANDPSFNDAALEYWDASLKGKGCGVFLHEGIMYIVTEKPFDKRRAATLAKASKDADADITALLKDWCKAEYGASGKEPEPKTHRERIVWDFLDKVSPGWKFPNWSFKGNARTIVRDQDFEFGKLTVVTTVNEIDARESARLLRPHFSPADQDTWIKRYFAAFKTANGLEETYAVLDLPDFRNGKADTSEVGEQYAQAESAITTYIKSSSICDRFRKEITEMSVPLVETNKSEVANAQGTEIVIMENIKTIIRVPRMQRLFLSGGKMANTACARIESGKLAEKKAFDPKAGIEEKLEALRGALCDNPGDAVLWNLYGRCLGDAGDRVGAVICYRNALNTDPAFEYAIVNLATVYKALGYESLGVRLAILACGTAKDKWSISESQKILFGP